MDLGTQNSAITPSIWIPSAGWGQNWTSYDRSLHPGLGILSRIREGLCPPVSRPPSPSLPCHWALAGECGGGGCGHRPCLAREQPEGPPPSFLVLGRRWDMLTGGGRLLGHCSGHHPAGTSSVDRTHWTHGGPGYLSLQRIGAADPTMALHTADGSHGQ